MEAHLVAKANAKAPTRLEWLKRRIVVLERESKLGANQPYLSAILDELWRVRAEVREMDGESKK